MSPLDPSLSSRRRLAALALTALAALGAGCVPYTVASSRVVEPGATRLYVSPIILAEREGIPVTVPNLGVRVGLEGGMDVGFNGYVSGDGRWDLPPALGLSGEIRRQLELKASGDLLVGLGGRVDATGLGAEWYSLKAGRLSAAASARPFKGPTAFVAGVALDLGALGIEATDGSSSHEQRFVALAELAAGLDLPVSPYVTLHHRFVATADMTDVEVFTLTSQLGVDFGGAYLNPDGFADVKAKRRARRGR